MWREAILASPASVLDLFEKLVKHPLRIKPHLCLLQSAVLHFVEEDDSDLTSVGVAPAVAVLCEVWRSWESKVNRV